MFGGPLPTDMSFAYRIPRAVSEACQRVLHDPDVRILSAREGWSIAGPSEHDPGGHLVPSVIATVRDSYGLTRTVVVGRP